MLAVACLGGKDYLGVVDKLGLVVISRTVGNVGGTSGDDLKVPEELLCVQGDQVKGTLALDRTQQERRNEQGTIQFAQHIPAFCLGDQGTKYLQ